MLCDDTDGAIIRGSTDMASTSGGGRWPEGRDLGLLEEDREWASTVIMALLRRRMIMKAAIKTISSIMMAPIIIPTIVGVPRPPPDVPLAFVFAISAAGFAVTLGITPESPVEDIVDGACGVVAITIALMRV